MGKADHAGFGRIPSARQCLGRYCVVRVHKRTLPDQLQSLVFRDAGHQAVPLQRVSLAPSLVDVVALYLAGVVDVFEILEHEPNIVMQFLQA